MADTPSTPNEPTGAGGASAQPAATPEQAGAYVAYQNAEEESRAVACRCAYDLFGHASPEACLERSREPDFARSCARLAFAPFAAALAPRYACLQSALEGGTACVTEQGCDGYQNCTLLANATSRTCGEPLPEEFAAFELLTSCERPERLGVPSGCPDFPSLGSALGSRIFEGDTTGKGDDITLSCHPDRQSFESADVTVEWEAPEAGTYSFATRASTFATQLGILTGCRGSELACSSSAGRVTSSVEAVAELAAAERVLIVIEGDHVIESGYFALSIERVD